MDGHVCKAVGFLSQMKRLFKNVRTPSQCSALKAFAVRYPFSEGFGKQARLAGDSSPLHAYIKAPVKWRAAF